MNTVNYLPNQNNQNFEYFTSPLPMNQIRDNSPSNSLPPKDNDHPESLEKYIFKLMEKDKQLLHAMQTAKDQSNIIEKLQYEISTKNDIITKLKNKNLELVSMLQKNGIAVDQNDPIIFGNIEDNNNNSNKQLIDNNLQFKLDDLEKIIIDFKNEITSLKEINDKLLEEKEELLKSIETKDNELHKNSIYSQNLVALNNKNASLNKEIQKKNNDIQSLDEKYCHLLKNNETFIHLFTNDLGNFLNFLESLNLDIISSETINDSNNVFKLPLSHLPNFEHTQLDQNFMLKYEILTKCVNQIKEKIIDTLNITKKKICEIKYSLTCCDNKNKYLAEEKNAVQKENYSLKNKITENTQDINNMKLNYEKKNTEFLKIQSELSDIKKKYNELQRSNEITNKEYNAIVNDIDNKLLQFPISDKNKKINLTITNKILYKIDSLIYLNKNLNKELNDTKNKYNEISQNFDDISRENKKKSAKILDYEANMKNDINNFKAEKEKEFAEQKEILFNKVQTLNEILDQGNQLIKGYEKEVADLKAKNKKLEKSLKIMAESHKELENLMKGNMEQGNLMMKNNENEGELEEIKEQESVVSFAKDDINEMKLNKMVNNFQLVEKFHDINNNDLINNRNELICGDEGNNNKSNMNNMFNINVNNVGNDIGNNTTEIFEHISSTANTNSERKPGKIFMNKK